VRTRTALRNEHVCLSLRSPVHEAPVAGSRRVLAEEARWGALPSPARSRSDEIVSYQRIQE